MVAVYLGLKCSGPGRLGIDDAVLMPGAAPRAPPQIQINFILESRGSCVRDVQYKKVPDSHGTRHGHRQIDVNDYSGSPSANEAQATPASLARPDRTICRTLRGSSDA